MSTNMTQIRDDLWQTRTDSPFPGLTTHAYQWRGPSGNILFYSPASDADFDAVEELGGVSAQYLSQLDEAGPMLARIADQFGSRWHAPVAELDGDTMFPTGDGTLVDIPGARSRRRRSVEVQPRAAGHDPAGHLDLQRLWRRYGDRDTRQWPVAEVHRRGTGERAVLS
jgi:hydroxyacylglutathione hydrolase